MVENNFLSPLNFKFVLNRTPNIEYAVQGVVIPGLAINVVQFQTPFVPISEPGVMHYSDLHLRFRVGEDMESYLEIYNWMVELSHPDNLPQFAQNQTDATLSILNSSRRPNMEVHFTDVWPTGLSQLSFDTTMTDVNYVTCDVSFNFSRLFFKKL